MSTYNRIGTSGKREEVLATEVSTGAAEAGDIPRLDSTGRLDNSLLPVGIGADTKMLVATEALSAGDYVNIFDDAGTASVRLADRTNGRRAHGFVNDAVAVAAVGEVFFEGPNTGLTGLTVGTQYFLGAAGAVEETPTTTSGEILQCLGVACSTTEIAFEAEEPIIRA